MTEYQFPIDTILIQPTAEEIGPFTFDLSPQLPDGLTIIAVTVTSYLDGTDTTADLIASSSFATNIVTVYINYPGASLHGVHKLTFEYTLNTTATDEADFWGVEVTDS